MFNKKYFLLLLILSTAFLIYSPSLKNDFIWDDFHLVVNDEDIKSLLNLPSIFKTHLFQNTGGSNFYRPIQTVSFMVDYYIWKLNSFGYHLTNLILHLLNVILVYFFVSRIFKNLDIGILTSLLFAVHPVNTEAVTYIAGRADPLSCIFFLAALLLYMRFKDRQDNFMPFLFSILFFVFSLLTKEAVLIFPLILILYDALILRQDSVDMKSLRLYCPYFLIVIFYAFFRLFIIGLPLGLLRHIPFGPYFFTMLKILVLYLGLLFFPVNLHMERIEPLMYSILEPQAITSMLTMICIIWFSVLIYRRYKGLFFFVAFFFTTLLPMLNILTINALMAEHWLYLPSIGVYALVSFGLVKTLDFKRPFVAQPLMGKLTLLTFVGFLSFFSVRTIFRNIEWGKPLEFYKNMLRHNPYSTRGHSNVGFIYMLDKNYKLAREEFQTAIEMGPQNPFCHYGLGLLDYLENDKTSAIKFWKKALDIAPFYRPAHGIMKTVLYKEDKRLRRLLKTVEVNPKNIMANYRLSSLYLKNGLYIEALDRLERILEVDPEYVNALFNRAWVYSKLGLYTKAIEEYERVKVLTPDDPDLYMNLGFCYAGLNKHKEARAMWQKAKALR